jgi:hypothetical protein
MMMEKYFWISSGVVLCLQLALSDWISASAQQLPTGSRQAGMGGSSVMLTDFWSCQNNQAGVALIDKISAGLYYESRFMLNNLSSKSLGIVIPAKIGVLGAHVSHFGYKLYSDIQIGLLYARSFSPYFRMGIQLDYLQLSLGDNYGSKHNLTFEIGVQSDVSENLTIGAWVFNPIRVNLASYDEEKISAILRVGILWQAGRNLIVCLETEKNTSMVPLIIRGGAEFSIRDKFFIRTGFSTNKEIFSMGFGYSQKIIRMDISAVMHQNLGFSPQFSVLFQF